MTEKVRKDNDRYQNSYIVRDRYPFADGTTGYFVNIAIAIYKELVNGAMNIVEIRAMNYAITPYD